MSWIIALNTGAINTRILADEISHTVDIFNTIRRFIHVTLLMQR